MEATVDRKAAELLKRAHELMNDKGRHWTKGRYRASKLMDNGQYETAYCSVGALEQARVDLGGDPDWTAFFMATRTLNAEAQVTGTGSASIIAWNDHPERTWTEVSTAFKNSIKKLLGK